MKFQYIRNETELWQNTIPQSMTRSSNVSSTGSRNSRLKELMKLWQLREAGVTRNCRTAGALAYDWCSFWYIWRHVIVFFDNCSFQLLSFWSSGQSRSSAFMSLLEHIRSHFWRLCFFACGGNVTIMNTCAAMSDRMTSYYEYWTAIHVLCMDFGRLLLSSHQNSF